MSESNRPPLDYGPLRGVAERVHMLYISGQASGDEIVEIRLRPSAPTWPTQWTEIENLEALASRPELRVKGWDSYSAAPLDDRAIEAARRFLGYAWNAVPTVNGGVQLEIGTSEFDVEIEWDETGHVEAVYAETAEDRKSAPTGAATPTVDKNTSIV